MIEKKGKLRAAYEKGDVRNGTEYNLLFCHLIDKAEKLNIPAEAVYNTFAKVNSDNKPIFNDSEALDIFSAIESYGADSPFVAFLTKTDNGKKVWNSDYMATFNVVYENKLLPIEDFNIFVPEQGEKPIDFCSMLSYAFAIKEEHLNPADVAQLIKNFRPDNPPACWLPPEPTALAAAFDYMDGTKSLHYEMTLHERLNKIRDAGYSDRFAYFLTSKDNGGNLVFSLNQINEYARPLINSSKETVNLIELKGPDGKFIFDIAEGLELADAASQGVSHEDLLRLAITDENGKPVLDCFEIQAGAKILLDPVKNITLEDFIEKSIKDKRETKKIEGQEVCELD